MGTPPYLLKVLCSYLTKRKMIVRHNGAFSSLVELPGGGPQGTNLGVLNFLVYINSCGIPLSQLTDSISASLNGEIHHTILPQPPPHISETQSRFKYIDDLALAEAINLKDLIPITEPIPQP